MSRREKKPVDPARYTVGQFAPKVDDRTAAVALREIPRVQLSKDAVGLWRCTMRDQKAGVTYIETGDTAEEAFQAMKKVAKREGLLFPKILPTLAL